VPSVPALGELIVPATLTESPSQSPLGGSAMGDTEKDDGLEKKGVLFKNGKKIK
jgi:hypothetical protein